MIGSKGGEYGVLRGIDLELHLGTRQQGHTAESHRREALCLSVVGNVQSSEAARYEKTLGEERSFWLKDMPSALLAACSFVEGLHPGMPPLLREWWQTGRRQNPVVLSLLLEEVRHAMRTLWGTMTKAVLHAVHLGESAPWRAEPSTEMSLWLCIIAARMEWTEPHFVLKTANDGGVSQLWVLLRLRGGQWGVEQGWSDAEGLERWEEFRNLRLLLEQVGVVLLWNARYSGWVVQCSSQSS